MNTDQDYSYDFSINPEAPLFVISIVSEMVDLPVWTLRKLDDMGVVQPARIGKKARCYSKIQIKTLHRIKYLLKEKRVNISGIKVILDMEHGDIAVVYQKQSSSEGADQHET
jgi:MerR family transcriptional regulator, heat shock protein HspR